MPHPDAPPVSYPVGRSFWGGLLMLAGWGAGALACGAWVAAGATGEAGFWPVVAVLAPGAWAAWWWAAQPRGLLDWDGGAWQWRPAAGADEPGGRIQPALDLQATLLLVWRGPGRRRWFWVDRRSAPARWAALRRAVYSRAGSAEPPGAGPSAAP